MTDLYKIGLIGIDSIEKRNKVINVFNLGKCNGKKLLERLNSLNIKLDDITKVLEE
mgnify:CR=1 FL=1